MPKTGVGGEGICTLVQTDNKMILGPLRGKGLGAIPCEDYKKKIKYFFYTFLFLNFFYFFFIFLLLADFADFREFAEMYQYYHA